MTITLNLWMLPVALALLSFFLCAVSKRCRYVYMELAPIVAMVATILTMVVVMFEIHRCGVESEMATISVMAEPWGEMCLKMREAPSSASVAICESFLSEYGDIPISVEEFDNILRCSNVHNSAYSLVADILTPLVNVHMNQSIERSDG